MSRAENANEWDKIQKDDAALKEMEAKLFIPEAPEIDWKGEFKFGRYSKGPSIGLFVAAFRPIINSKKGAWEKLSDGDTADVVAGRFEQSIKARCFSNKYR